METAQLPAVGYTPQTATTTVLKCRVVRLSLGGFQGQFASHGQGEQLFVRLRAASWQGEPCVFPVQHRCEVTDLNPPVIREDGSYWCNPVALAVHKTCRGKTETRQG